MDSFAQDFPSMHAKTSFVSLMSDFEGSTTGSLTSLDEDDSCDDHQSNLETCSADSDHSSATDQSCFDLTASEVRKVVIYRHVVRIIEDAVNGGGKCFLRSSDIACGLDEVLAILRQRDFTVKEEFGLISVRAF